MSLHKGKHAHRAVAKAVANGTLIKPENCEECGVKPSKIAAHHTNGYDEEHWLDVEWLCNSCHMGKHNYENSRQAGLSRARNLTPEQRSEIARKGGTAAREYWNNLSPEERVIASTKSSEASLRAWKTRRARQSSLKDHDNGTSR